MAYLHEAWSVGFRFHGTVITRLRPSGPWSKCLETATLDPYYTDRKHVTICQVSLTFFRHGVYKISGFFSLLKWQLFIISKSSCALIACNYTFENVIIASVFSSGPAVKTNSQQTEPVCCKVKLSVKDSESHPVEPLIAPNCFFRLTAIEGLNQDCFLRAKQRNEEHIQNIYIGPV